MKLLSLKFILLVLIFGCSNSNNEKIDSKFFEIYSGTEEHNFNWQLEETNVK